jgi:hypothetical protein
MIEFKGSRGRQLPQALKEHWDYQRGSLCRLDFPETTLHSWALSGILLQILALHFPLEEQDSNQHCFGIWLERIVGHWIEVEVGVEVGDQAKMAPPKSTPKRKAVAEPTTRTSQKAKTGVKVKAKVIYVLKGLSPRILPTGSRKKRLRTNLKVMGCNNLLLLPWGYTSNNMLEEIRTRTSPREFQGSVRANPARSTNRDCRGLPDWGHGRRNSHQGCV